MYMPSDEQLTLLIVRLELFPVEQANTTKNKNEIYPSITRQDTNCTKYIYQVYSVN